MMLGLLLIVGLIALSWLLTCLVIKLIAACFGLTCTWVMATGIWLIFWILKSLFNNDD